MYYLMDGVRRNSKLLIYNDYIYYKNRTRNEVIYWKCSQKHCETYLKTNKFEIFSDTPDIVILQEGDHLHDTKRTLITQNHLKNQMKHSIKNILLSLSSEYLMKV